MRPTAYDYTGLRDRPKLMWTLGEYALPWGVHIPALFAGLGAGLFALVVAGVFLDGLWPFVVFVAAWVAVYVAWGKPLPSKMFVSQAIVVWLDFLFRQPKRIHGFTAAAEPDRIEWHLILWEPVDPGWLASYQHTTRWLRLQRRKATRTLDRPHADRAA